MDKVVVDYRSRLSRIRGRSLDHEERNAFEPAGFQQSIERIGDRAV